jgi:hypothetical protein
MAGILSGVGGLGSIFQSNNDPEMRFRFQYKMILKVGRVRGLGSGSFLARFLMISLPTNGRPPWPPMALFLVFLHRKVLVLAVDL